MKTYEKRERTFYEPIKVGKSGKLGKIITIAALAGGVYTLYKKLMKEEKYPEFDADITNDEQYESDEEEKFAEKILKAAKKAGKDLEEKVEKVKKSL